MKAKRLALIAGLLAAGTMMLTLAGCGGSGSEETESATESITSIVSEPTATEPESLPFTMPKGYTYNAAYSTAETALYDNGKGIAITFARTESSASYLLSAQNNAASLETTESAIQASRPDLSKLTISDFNCDNGSGYICYTYTMAFTYQTVDQVSYVYTYTNDTDNYKITVDAPADQTESAAKVAKTVQDSFQTKDTDTE